MESGDGFILGRGDVTAGCEIIGPESAVAGSSKVDRKDIVRLRVIIARKIRPCREDIAISDCVKYLDHGHTNVNRIVSLLRLSMTEAERHNHGQGHEK